MNKETDFSASVNYAKKQVKERICKELIVGYDKLSESQKMTIGFAMEKYATQYQLYVSGKSEEVISEWQLCPKCFGEGTTYTNGLSTNTTQTCIVCNGSKILVKPIIQP
jgi:hypothetical protein